MDNPGITVTCPADAPASGPIPIEAILRADARTYWDNDGILDKALTVALVRRDRPGLRFLDKIDRGALMLPDEPLPGRPSDAQLDADTGMVIETKLVDASTREGSADYFVTAAFSKWWGGVRTLRVSDPHGRVLSSNQAPRVGPDLQPWPVRMPPTHGDPSIRIERTGGGSVLVAPFRVATPTGQALDGSGRSRRWLSLLGFKLDTRGGACGGVFDLSIETGAGETVGEAAIPISALGSKPDAGCWMFLGFVGEEVLPPNEIWLTNDDVR